MPSLLADLGTEPKVTSASLNVPCWHSQMCMLIRALLAGTSSISFVGLGGPQPRHHLQLAAGGGSHLVTCRVISSRGHLHAVFFRDRKPPVLLQNTTDVALEVGSQSCHI